MGHKIFTSENVSAKATLVSQDFEVSGADYVCKELFSVLITADEMEAYKVDLANKKAALQAPVDNSDAIAEIDAAINKADQVVAAAEAAQAEVVES